MLLEAGCCFPYEILWGLHMSEEMAAVVATHISIRRLRLLKLAQTQLGVFLGNESVAFADSAAATICDALDKEKIQVPPCLRVGWNYQSIYLNTAIPFDVFKQFWQMGFCHFESIDCIGRTPMMTEDSRWSALLNFQSFHHVKETISWLCKHGFMREKVNDPLNIGLNVFATGYHYMAAKFASLPWISHCSHKHTDHKIQLLANLPSDTTIEDNCMCWCNAEGHGCSPVKLFLKTLFLYPYYSSSSLVTALHKILHRQSLYAPDSDELLILVKEVLRLLTFEALDMTHTCCFYDRIREHDPCNLLPEKIQYEWAIFCCDSDNIMEIRSCSEGKRSAALLKDMMAEFTPQLQLFSPSCFAFKGFIHTYWRRRISQIYIAAPTAVDDLRQHQAFQGFGVSSSSSRTRVLPESVHRLLGRDFRLLGPHETISDEECISEVSRYMGMQCEDCVSFNKAECSISGANCCESDQADSD
ncbi:hypothetical protein NXS19_011103 [Fusarium pseudograminearum]|nr:hypothetical protein NXS19_011103 [Fusarium pseudograminearum]